MKTSKFLVIFLCFAILFSALTIPAMAAEDVKVILNGEELFFDVSPQIIDGRTMVPMRKIFEKLGADVDWNGETQTITANKDDIVIIMQIDNTTIEVSGKEIVLDVPPQLIGDRTLVPVRAVAEGLDTDVDWNEATRTVIIISEIYSNGITPLLWHVTSPTGQTMYLFGSIHVAEESLYPLPDYIMDAFDSCDYLALEINILALETELDDEEALEAYFASMIYEDWEIFFDDTTTRRKKTIADDIGKVLHEKAKAAIIELDLDWIGEDFPIESLDNFKPSYWSQIFGEIAVEKSGLSFEYGLDRFFSIEASKQNIVILEAESMEARDVLLDFSPPVEAWLLEGSLEIDASAADTLEMYRLWKRGNENELASYLRISDEDLTYALVAEYVDGMITQRDLIMTESAIRFMDEGKKVFFVVGMAHMFGSSDNGIVEQLREKGYIVETVSP